MAARAWVTALRLAKYFGTSAEFWMGLQIDFDMATVRVTMEDALARIICRDDVGTWLTPIE